MATVVPKLLYSKKDSCDIPVWEIKTPKGVIYYERKHYRGYQPVGCNKFFDLGRFKLSVVDVVRPVGKKEPVVLLEKDGYVAPSNWYRNVQNDVENHDESDLLQDAHGVFYEEGSDCELGSVESYYSSSDDELYEFHE